MSGKRKASDQNTSSAQKKAKVPSQVPPETKALLRPQSDFEKALIAVGKERDNGAKGTVLVELMKTNLTRVQPLLADMQNPKLIEIISKLKYHQDRSVKSAFEKQETKWIAFSNEFKKLNIPAAFEGLNLPQEIRKIKGVLTIYESLEADKTPSELNKARLALSVSKEINKWSKNDNDYKNVVQYVCKDTDGVRSSLLSGKISASRIPFMSSNASLRAQTIDEVYNFMSDIAGIFGENSQAFSEPLGDDANDLWKKVWGTMKPLKASCERPNACCIGIMGSRGVGKSTLINNILGVDILPISDITTATASVTEISSCTQEEYSVSVEFSSIGDFTAPFREAHATLLAYEGDLDDLEEDEDIKKAIEIIKAHDGKKYLTIEDLQAKLAELEAVSAPFTYVLPEYRKMLELQTETTPAEDIHELCGAISKYIVKGARYWPVVDRIKIKGPFDTHGSLKVGMTILDIPGTDDGQVCLTRRIWDAVNTCPHRLLVLRTEVAAVYSARNAFKAYFNGYDTFSVTVNKAENLNEMTGESFNSEEEFKEVANAAVERIREKMESACNAEWIDFSRLKMYVSELRPQRNEEFHKANFNAMVKEITERSMEGVSDRYTCLRSLLETIKQTIMSHTSGGSGQKGVSSGELVAVATRVFNTHFEDQSAFVDTFFRKPPQSPFPREQYRSGISAQSMMALFRRSGRLVDAFAFDLESAVCPPRDPNFVSSVFKLDLLWGTLLKELKKVCGEGNLYQRLNAVIENSIQDMGRDLTHNFGQTQVQEALTENFYGWAKFNGESGNGTRERLVKKLVRWVVDNRQALLDKAKEVFLRSLSTQMEQFREIIISFLAALDSDDLPCRHDGKCSCSQRNELKAYFEHEPRRLVPEPKEGESWRTAHLLGKGLAPAENLESFITNSTRRTPGFISIEKHSSKDDLFCLRLVQPISKRAPPPGVKVASIGRVVITILQQILAPRKDNRLLLYYSITLELLKKVVELVARTIDEALQNVLI